MKTRTVFLLPVLLVLLAGVAQGDILVLTPSQAVVAPADESGVTRALLQFDLSGLPRDEGLLVSTAILDWEISVMPADRSSEYAVHTVTQSWSPAGVASGSVPSVEEEPFEVWDRDPVRSPETRLRFFLGSLVRAWIDEAVANHGVVVAGEDLDPQSLSGELQNVRLTLTFRIE